MMRQCLKNRHVWMGITGDRCPVLACSGRARSIRRNVGYTNREFGSGGRRPVLAEAPLSEAEVEP